LNRVIFVEWVKINSAEITEGLPTANCPCTSRATWEGFISAGRCDAKRNPLPKQIGIHMPDCPDYLNILFDIIGHSQKQAKSSVVLWKRRHYEQLHSATISSSW